MRGETEFMLMLVDEIKTYWIKPKPGDYVSYSEFAALAAGHARFLAGQTMMHGPAIRNKCFADVGTMRALAHTQ